MAFEKQGFFIIPPIPKFSNTQYPNPQILPYLTLIPGLICGSNSP